MKHEELAEKLREIKSALGKEDVMVCIYKGNDGELWIMIHGRKRDVISALALALKNDDHFSEAIKIASQVNLLTSSLLSGLFDDKKDKENEKQEADRLAKDFLRNNGFKMEGE